MKFPRQFVGGILVGLAFGILIGAWVTEGKTEVNYTTLAGVGIILAIIGMFAAQLRSGKS